MKIHCLHDAMLPTKDLKPHPKNRNKHPKYQIARLKKILEYQGWRHAIKVSKRSGFITAGHGRLEAAIGLKMKEVPVVYQDYESEEQEIADITSDNAIASWAELDIEGITLDISELEKGFDLELLGIKNFEIKEENEAQCDEDEVPEQVEPKSKLGDLYLLGEHRLLCGDSTSIEAVEKLMDGHKADMVFTDPPYNVNYEGKTAEKLTIKNDKMDGEQFSEFLQAVFTAILSSTTAGVPIYMSCPLEDGKFLQTWLESGIKLQSILIWLKNTIVLGRKDYQYKHEQILYGWINGAAHRWYGERDKSTIFECAKPSRNGEHPTMKPVELVEYYLGNSSKVSDRILDLFGGSGSTLIACEKTHRKCFMMELDTHYIDVIVARWEKYTGKKAILETGFRESQG